MSEPQTLTELHQKLAAEDAELRKYAEEEDAAGRIMARGFSDELFKISQGPELKPRKSKVPPSRTGIKPSVEFGPEGGSQVKGTGQIGPQFVGRGTVGGKPGVAGGAPPPKPPKPGAIDVGKLPGVGGQPPLPPR